MDWYYVDRLFFCDYFDFEGIREMFGLGNQIDTRVLVVVFVRLK